MELEAPRLSVQIRPAPPHAEPAPLGPRFSRLANVRHRDELKRFARNYKKKSFRNLREEYEYVERSISNLLDMFLPNTLVDVIERDMKSSLAAGILEENIRESFIHPFQLFLLGSVVIDKFYQSFQQWYDSTLCTSNATCLESAWLLATVFHDRSKKVNVLREALELEIGEFGNKLPDEDVYLGLISSFYEYKSTGNPLNTWNVNAPKNPTLESVLIDYSERWAHGAKGSALMLRLVCKDPRNVTPRDIASAFAIAVHDDELWDELGTTGIFPLNMDLFPLACLLLSLDAIQEWGRRQTVSEETRLVDFSVTQQSVICEVAFESGVTLNDKLEEYRKAKQCIRSPSLDIISDLKIRARLCT